MTRPRAPRQCVRSPAARRAAAPANRAPREGTPSSIVCTVEPPVTTAPPVDVVPPPVVEPAPPEATEAEEAVFDEAADAMRAARRSRPRVAMTAARQARPARASAPAAGTRS